jgi:hypothetical protein
MMDQETVENELTAIWVRCHLPDKVVPQHLDEALMVYIRWMPYLAEMSIRAGKELKEKVDSLRALAKNDSQLDRMKRTTVEYYINNLIDRNIDRLSDWKTTIQSKLKNVQREYGDAGKNQS